VLKQCILGGALVVVTSAVPLAQGNRPAASPRDQVQARYNIAVMEGVLERAVEHGADSLRRQVRRVMPDMLLLSGGAEARGFRLDGYGVFFDVEVPVMRRSVAWSLRSMIDEGGITALQQLKAFVEQAKVADAGEKATLMQAVKRLELQVVPPQMQAQAPVMTGPAMPTSQRGTVSAMNTVEPPVVSQQPSADAALVEDPSGAYEKEVISSLIDAMLDHSGPIGVGTDEWLTVAARDNEHRDRLVPGDPYDLLTIVLRVKGSDLAAFRADRITRDEARKRVEVREF
jgi:hypothetical protein